MDQFYDFFLFLMRLVDLFGRPLPLGRPGLGWAFPSLSSEDSSFYDSSGSKSSSSKEGSLKRRNELIDL